MNVSPRLSASDDSLAYGADGLNEGGGTVNLEDMTKSELMVYAEGQGISLNMRMTKAAMIEEIEAEG